MPTQIPPVVAKAWKVEKRRERNRRYRVKVKAQQQEQNQKELEEQKQDRKTEARIRATARNRIYRQKRACFGERVLESATVLHSSLSWKGLMESPISKSKASAEELNARQSEFTTVTSSSVICAALEGCRGCQSIEQQHVEPKAHQRLVVFLKDAILQPWDMSSNPSKKDIHNQITKALLNLDTRAPPKVPAIDRRYPGGESRRRTQVRSQDVGEVYGVHHFGLWRQQGHSGTSPTLTSQTAPTVTGLNHVVEFYRGIAPIIKSIGLIFSGVDKEMHARYKSNYKRWAARSPLSVLTTTPEACFTTLAVVRNVCVAPHKDSSDIKDGWVAMCCWGDFTGGNLFLPDLKVQLEFRPGDVIFFRAAVLEHMVAPFTGDRTSFVFHTKKDMGW